MKYFYKFWHMFVQVYTMLHLKKGNILSVFVSLILYTEFYLNAILVLILWNKIEKS